MGVLNVEPGTPPCRPAGLAWPRWALFQGAGEGAVPKHPSCVGSSSPHLPEWAGQLASKRFGGSNQGQGKPTPNSGELGGGRGAPKL